MDREVETQSEVISLLNTLVRYRIAPSPIHGVGIFAIRDIEKGAKLYSDMFPQTFSVPYKDFKKLFPEVRQMILERWPLVYEGKKFLYPDTRLQAYLNHSDDPNYDAVNDIVLRDIKKGEEITEDYRKIPNWEVIFPFIKNPQELLDK